MSPEPSSVETPPVSSDDFSVETLRELHQALLLPRLIEEKMLRLLRQGRLSKWFSGIGQEAIAVGVVAALEPRDVILPMHRNLGVFTGRGLDLAQLLRQVLGKAGGFGFSGNEGVVREGTAALLRELIAGSAEQTAAAR